MGIMGYSSGKTSDQAFAFGVISQLSSSNQAMVSARRYSRSSLGDHALGLSYDDSITQCCRDVTAIQYDRSRIHAVSGTVYAPKESLIAWVKAQVASDPVQLAEVRKASSPTQSTNNRLQGVSR